MSQGINRIYDDMLECPFELPVKVLDEALEDKHGNVIAHFAWLEEANHVNRARKNAQFVCEIVNRFKKGYLKKDVETK